MVLDKTIIAIYVLPNQERESAYRIRSRKQSFLDQSFDPIMATPTYKRKKKKKKRKNKTQYEANETNTTCTNIIKLNLFIGLVCTVYWKMVRHKLIYQSSAGLLRGTINTGSNPCYKHRQGPSYAVLALSEPGLSRDACARECKTMNMCTRFDYIPNRPNTQCRYYEADSGHARVSNDRMLCITDVSRGVHGDASTNAVVSSRAVRGASTRGKHVPVPPYKIQTIHQPIVDAAVALQKNTTKPFIIVMHASMGMVPMIKSWLCNTKTMVGVHQNTLIIVDQKGYNMLQHFETEATVVVDALPASLQGSWKYGTRGYWRTTQNRVAVIGDLLRAGITMLLCEADATWVRNVYEQNDLVSNWNQDLIGMSDDEGGVGFGFLRIKSNDVVVGLWNYVQSSVDRGMGGPISNMKHYENLNSKNEDSTKSEQKYFNDEWHRLSNVGTLKVKTLDTCKYPNGKWYDSGRGGNGAKYRRRCRNKDAHEWGSERTNLVVIQNNWMVGNERKVLRAKRWNHWFLDGDGNTCSSHVVLKDAIDSAVKGFPPHGKATKQERERRRRRYRL